MGPLIYDPGKEPVKTGYNHDPMKWNQTWYQNNKPEWSSIWATIKMVTDNVSIIRKPITRQ